MSCFSPTGLLAQQVMACPVSHLWVCQHKEGIYVMVCPVSHLQVCDHDGRRGGPK